MREYKYQSDMISLGYDPDAFDEEEKKIENNEEAVAIEEEKDSEETNAKIEENAFNEEPSDASGVEQEPEEQEKPSENNEENYQDEEIRSDEKVFKERKKSAGKKALIFIVSLFAIVLLFFVSLGLGGFFDTTGDDEITENYMVPADKGTGKINILLLGVDKDKLRTDTIVVASYDLDDSKVNILSIPRDTRMYIGNSYQKINAAHAISQSGKIKGPQGTIEAVTRLTGIPINYYVEFSFDAFKNVIDALGGVDFDVPRDMYYKDPVQELYINLKEGYQHLDGDKAEQLVRFRQYPDGDIGRVATQQAFIKAFAEQKLNLSIISKIPDLYEVFKKDIQTNFTLMDVTRYAKNLEELSSENIQMFQLPGNFSGPEYKASYWIADMSVLKTLIKTEFDYDVSDITIHSADGSSVSKDIKDGVKTAAPKASSTPKSTTSAEPEKTQKATKKPEESKKPSQSSSPSATKKPDKTVAPTKKATQEPEVEPTEKPEKTASPTKEPTKRPARPTPNVTNSDDEE